MRRDAAPTSQPRKRAASPSLAAWGGAEPTAADLAAIGADSGPSRAVGERGRGAGGSRTTCLSGTADGGAAAHLGTVVRCGACSLGANRRCTTSACRAGSGRSAAFVHSTSRLRETDAPARPVASHADEGEGGCNQRRTVFHAAASPGPVCFPEADRLGAGFGSELAGHHRGGDPGAGDRLLSQAVIGQQLDQRHRPRPPRLCSRRRTLNHRRVCAATGASMVAGGDLGRRRHPLPHHLRGLRPVRAHSARRCLCADGRSHRAGRVPCAALQRHGHRHPGHRRGIHRAGADGAGLVGRPVGAPVHPGGRPWHPVAFHTTQVAILPAAGLARLVRCFHRGGSPIPRPAWPADACRAYGHFPDLRRRHHPVPHPLARGAETVRHGPRCRQCDGVLPAHRCRSG